MDQGHESAIEGWYWIAGKQQYQRGTQWGDRMQWSAYVSEDPWHGGWVASTNSPEGAGGRWSRRIPTKYLFEGMHFADPTAAMVAVEVELSNSSA